MSLLPPSSGSWTILKHKRTSSKNTGAYTPNYMASRSEFSSVPSKKGSKKLFLSTPWRHTGEAKVQLHPFLTLVLNGDVWSASCPVHHLISSPFHVKELQHPLKRRLGGPQSWSECCGEDRNLLTCWDSQQGIWKHTLGQDSRKVQPVLGEVW